MSKDLHEMTVKELRDELIVRAFELNLIMRGLSVLGVKVDVDTVERTNAAQPEGYPEIIVSTRDAR
jgi:hypothetical protein